MTAHIEAGVDSDPAADSGLATVNPAIFGALFVPFGISSGYVTVTLAFLLARDGLSTAVIGTIIALAVWPQTVKMLWAPLVDTVGNPKLWYGAGAISVGLSILLMSVLPKTEAMVGLIIAVIVLSSITSTFVSMAAEIFLAHLVAPAARGRASGWSQAGNLGGAGIGGGIGLLLAENVAQSWVSGAVLAAICFACWAATLWLPPVARHSEALNYLSQLKEVAVNVWAVARSRLGYLALLIMLLPLGSGGVPWAAISTEWGAGSTMVALVNGVAGGVAAMVGAMIAGFVCDRMELKKAYCLFGLLVGLVAALMVLAPRTPTVFVIGVLAYQMMIGTTYTGYAAIVLEAIGKKSVATNWNLLAALSNIPIAAMSMVSGLIHDRLGTDAMLLGELVIPAAAIALFALFVVATAPRRSASTGLVG